MTDLDGLLHAVLESPADDTARLIYADAMEESGRPVNLARAEFIRLQLADEGHERQRELLVHWLADWFGEVVQPLPTGWWAVGKPGDPKAFCFNISRGFIHQIANYGLPKGEWTVWTPWEFAEAFSESVVDLFTNHPLERVILEIGLDEEWQVWPDATGWSCGHPNHFTICSLTSRDRFATNLARSLRERAFVLARNLFNAQQMV